MGVILPVMSLTLVLVIGISSLLVGMIGYIIFSLPSTGGGKAAYSFEFLGMISRSFSSANIISDVNIYDRTFLEQSIESMATGSTENGNANMELITDFLDKYDMRFYSISIERGGSEIFSVSNKLRKCGEGNKGICSRKYDVKQKECGVGRIEIAGSCKKNEVCCEENVNAYAGRHLYEVVRCGSGDTGICTTVPYISFTSLFPTRCETGRIYVEEHNKDCENANGGDTPLCCAPLASTEAASESGNLAQIPLLFRGRNAPGPSFGYVNVITDDR